MKISSADITNSYRNPFGIDLQKYHESICRITDYEEGLIDAINESGRVIFEDGVSSGFRLVMHNTLLYLLGEKSCYPCSHVVESAYGADLNWVTCVVMPGKVKINGETDIRKSGIIVSLFSDLVSQISNISLFHNFIENLEFTFGSCKWFKRIYSLSMYIKLVRFWNYKEKILKLFELGLLYPLELALYSIYKGIEIKNDQILKYFIASLAESTNKILQREEINQFLQKLSLQEIEDILAIDLIKKNVHLELLNDDTFADLLELDGTDRHGTFVNDVYYLYHMRQQSSTIFVTIDFKKTYLKILNKNFRALENRMRSDKGFDHVGSYYMEKLLLNRLQVEFPDHTIVSQYSPIWLRPQRLDIFVQECNIAVEYHGAQHFLPIDFFGGKEGLRLRQELDLLKKQKCESNGVRLIEISYEEDFDFAFDQLRDLILNF